VGPLPESPFPHISNWDIEVTLLLVIMFVVDCMLMREGERKTDFRVKYLLMLLSHPEAFKNTSNE
jgi:hypothetical protein